MFQEIYDAVKKADTSPGGVIGDALFYQFRAAVFRPVQYYTIFCIFFGSILLAKYFLGYELPDAGLTYGVLFLAVFAIAWGEIGSYEVNRVVYEKLKIDPDQFPDPKSSVYASNSFLFCMDALSFGILIPLSIGAGYILAGDVKLGMSPFLYFLASAILLILVFRFAPRILRALSRFGKLGKVIGTLHFLIFMILFLVAVLGPAIGLNMHLTEGELLRERTENAMTQMALLLSVSFATIGIISAVYFFSVGPAVFAILPVKRGSKYWPQRSLRLVHYIEFILNTQISGIMIVCIAVGPLIYALYAIDNSILVFFAFNIFAGIHVVLTAIAFSRDLDRPTLRLIRRAGAQATAVTILVLNLFLFTGYSVGWVAFQFFPRPEFEGLPLPGMFFGFHGVHPADLPILAQMEAMVITVVAFLALSWAFITIAKRAWGEAAFVIGSSALAVLSPQIIPPLREVWVDVVGPDGTSLSWTSNILLTLIVPAITNFLSSEVQHLVDPETETLSLCVSCSEPVDRTDRFCPSCGAKQEIEASPSE